MSHAYHMQYLISKQISSNTLPIKKMLKMEMNLHVNQHLKTGVEIFWEVFCFYFGNYFFSMVSIGGGDVSGGGGLSLQRR